MQHLLATVAGCQRRAAFDRVAGYYELRPTDDDDAAIYRIQFIFGAGMGLLDKKHCFECGIDKSESGWIGETVAETETGERV